MKNQENKLSILMLLEDTKFSKFLLPTYVTNAFHKVLNNLYFT